MKFESRVDGHMLMCRDGSVRWLTLWERLLVLFKLTTAEKLDMPKRCSGPMEEDFNDNYRRHVKKTQEEPHG